MLDPESMLAEQIIDKYIAVVVNIFEIAGQETEAFDDVILNHLKAALQIGKVTYLMTEAAERITKQFGIEPPQFPWSVNPDRNED